MCTYATSGPDADERGETLAEILITIFIMGVALMGILPAVVHSLTAADRVKKHAQVEQVLSAAVQAINGAAYSTTCDYAAVLNAVSSAPRPTIVANNVARWNGTTFVIGCPAAGANAVFKTVRIRLTVATVDGRSSQWVEVVKRP